MCEQVFGFQRNPKSGKEKWDSVLCVVGKEVLLVFVTDRCTFLDGVCIVQDSFSII